MNKYLFTNSTGPGSWRGTIVARRGAARHCRVAAMIGADWDREGSAERRPCSSSVRALIAVVATVLLAALFAEAHEPPAFSVEVTTYRSADGDLAFALDLELPFGTEDSSRPHVVRARPISGNAYLVYPRSTQFTKRHTAFHGRLRGTGVARIQIEHDIEHARPDGSRALKTRRLVVDVPIPTAPVGERETLVAWAGSQAAHFRAGLLRLPGDSFLQYLAPHSQWRYGLLPDPARRPPPTVWNWGRAPDGRYSILEVAGTLQDQLLQSPFSTTHPQDPPAKTIPIQQLTASDLPMHGIEARVAKNGPPAPVPVPVITKWIPADQCVILLNSSESVERLLTLADDIGVRLAGSARRPIERLQRQLGVRTDDLRALFAEGAVRSLAVTSPDSPLDTAHAVSLVFDVAAPEVFDALLMRRAQQMIGQHPAIQMRTFTYRGQRVAALSRVDRVVSAYLTRRENVAVLSNSETAIRRMIDTQRGKVPAIAGSASFRDLVTRIPPSSEPVGGYFAIPEGFVRRQISPATRIAEARRRVCRGHLTELSHAALFYRLENGRWPTDVNALLTQRYLRPTLARCPHDGVYTLDPLTATPSCSVHNRLSVSTPASELVVSHVTENEHSLYKRFKEQYTEFWQNALDPVAIRWHAGEPFVLDACVLPLSVRHSHINARTDGPPLPPTHGNIPSTAFLSFNAASIGSMMKSKLREFPLVRELAAVDPTLGDLGWLGERFSVHLCDADPIVEIDPEWMYANSSSLPYAIFGALTFVVELPICATVDLEDADQATHALEQLASRAPLREIVILWRSELEVYRLLTYRGYARYVLTCRFSPLRLRAYMAIVDKQLVATSTPALLERLLDARIDSHAATPQSATPAHATMTLRPAIISKMREDLRVYWLEKARRACHASIVPLEMMHRLYDDPSVTPEERYERRFGVHLICPATGVYEWDTERGTLECTIHRDRQYSRQGDRSDSATPIDALIEGFDRIHASIRFADDALLTRVEIDRAEHTPKAR